MNISNQIPGLEIRPARPPAQFALGELRFLNDSFVGSKLFNLSMHSNDRKNNLQDNLVPQR
ncbi:MAG: hypothetical protein EZS28_006599, partial [Streblomastix strix]